MSNKSLIALLSILRPATGNHVLWVARAPHACAFGLAPEHAQIIPQVSAALQVGNGVFINVHTFDIRVKEAA